MIKKILVAAIVPACAIILFSCRGNVIVGRGEKTSIKLSASNPAGTAMSVVDIAIPATIDITVKPGATATAEIDGYKNLLDHVRASTNDATLTIKTDLEGTVVNLDQHAGTKIMITVPSLASLDLSGAADAMLHGSITGDHLKLNLSGAGKVVIDALNVDNFNTDVSGAANILINSGMVRRATYQLSGASKIYAFPLITSRTNAEISGAGRAEVTANDSLSANISGAGTIHYKGHPAVSKDVSGVGSIKDAN